MEGGRSQSQKCIENACDNDGDNGGQPSYQLIGTLKEGGWNGRFIAIGSLSSLHTMFDLAMLRNWPPSDMQAWMLLKKGIREGDFGSY